MSQARSSLQNQSYIAGSAGRQTVVRHVWFSAANVLFALVIGLVLVAAVGLTILPRVVGFQTYIVLSGSMEPTIPTASVVVVVPVKPSELQAGDIISFTRWTDGEEPVTITHRINQVVEPGTFPRFETKGTPTRLRILLPCVTSDRPGRSFSWFPTWAISSTSRAHSKVAWLS